MRLRPLGPAHCLAAQLEQYALEFVENQRKCCCALCAAVKRWNGLLLCWVGHSHSANRPQGVLFGAARLFLSVCLLSSTLISSRLARPNLFSKWPPPLPLPTLYLVVLANQSSPALVVFTNFCVVVVFQMTMSTCQIRNIIGFSRFSQPEKFYELYVKMDET